MYKDVAGLRWSLKKQKARQAVSLAGFFELSWSSRWCRRESGHWQNKACGNYLLFLKNIFSHSHFVYNFVAHPSQVFRTRTVPQNALSSDTGTARLSACSFLNLPCKPADAHGRYAVTSILLSQSVTLLASPARPRVSASHRG